MLGSFLNSLFGKQYTIGDLMKIDSGRQERAAGCKVKLVGTFHELKRENILSKFKSFFSGESTINVYYVIFKFEVTSESGSVYYVFIKINPDFDLTKWQDNQVQVYCGCADFKYRSSYILGKNGSLFLNNKIKSELGQALTEAPKGKTKTTLLCKHSYAALEWLVGNYSNIMKTI